MRQRLAKSVVVVGMMGAGKTAVGTVLARRLGVPFADSDLEIEKASNLTIAEIFAREGEAFFREKEEQVVMRLLDDNRRVLSLGGGAFLSPQIRAVVASRGISVWLRATVDVLWQRVRHKKTRPLLRTPDPRGTLARLTEERAPVYGLADVVVDTRADITAVETAGLVYEALAAREDVLA
ncbi:shikimate kinase [Roseitranquillus sediminis]|uniref:shikimate kinase n=1 Tax=Roseitranquillus sediminis TaxID=2809051 RepID=UPI001D0C87C6|nr:shikimate kinase [Roseitranquillus sediminis]MBM9595587.1 shikimate kinase [Roseitranquillus sediminis]